MCYCTPSIKTPYCNNCNGYMRTELEQLRQRVAELEACKPSPNYFELACFEYRQQLAASQLENKRLRSALETVKNGFATDHQVNAVIDFALSTPTDTEALKSYIKEQFGEPVSREFQSKDGTWYGFIDEKHYQNTLVDSSYHWPIRYLYALKDKP